MNKKVILGIAGLALGLMGATTAVYADEVVDTAVNEEDIDVTSEDSPEPIEGGSAWDFDDGDLNNEDEDDYWPEEVINDEDEEEATETSMWPMWLSFGAIGVAVLAIIIFNVAGRKYKKQPMIAHVRGQVTEKFLNAIIVDVQGVGYEVLVTASDADKVGVGDEIKFYTYHSVRENGEDLYGFSSLAAKKMFEMLLSVNGVGPKAALAILSLGSPEEVRNAIANSDVVYVAKASGVGKKSAERVIVDLRDKVGLPSEVGASTSFVSVAAGPEDEALDALIALGFPLKEATAALAKVDNSLSTEERIRLALKKQQFYLE